MITLSQMNEQGDLDPKSEEGYVGRYYWRVWRYDFWPRFHWKWLIDLDCDESLRDTLRWQFQAIGHTRLPRTAKRRAITWIAENVHS